jgi:ankyrin repeat protein
MAIYEDLLAAVNAGDAQKTKALLQENSAIPAPAPSAESVLLAAIYRGRQDLVELIRPHIQPNIFEAAALGETARVKELAKQNKDAVRGHSADGWTALHLAAFMGHRETAEALLELGSDLSALSKNQMANQPLHAALAGKTDRPLVEMLIERGAKVNARGGSGVTPLHLAASRGDSQLCHLLIAKGADPAAKMDDGVTPSAIAAQRGHAAVAEQLQRHVR